MALFLVFTIYDRPTNNLWTNRKVIISKMHWKEFKISFIFAYSFTMHLSVFAYNLEMASFNVIKPEQSHNGSFFGYNVVFVEQKNDT